MFSCCWKKKGDRQRNRSSTRSHQRLCAQESGTISIPVQRVAGPPVSLDLIKGNNNGSIKGSLNDIRGGSLNPDSPLNPRASVLRHESMRNVHRESGRYRDSGNEIRRHTDSPSLSNHSRYGSRLDSRDSRLGSRGLTDSPRSSALQTAIERFSQQTEDISGSRRRGRILGDGFTLSSSFEGLDKSFLEYGVQDSKVSSYDNLYSGREEPDTASMERKQSLYDNVDDAEGRPLVAGTGQNPPEEPRDHQPSPVAVKRRRSSRTLPLRFTMFTGGHRTAQDKDDQDYVNLPVTSSPSRDTADSALTGGSKPVAPERKKKLRRGSKTLKLFCPRRPSMLSKIEKQVLAYVPIYGEPSPGSTGADNPLDQLHFPPPPSNVSPAHPSPAQEVPLLQIAKEPCSPVSPFMSYANPMYCPNTSTPGACLDMDDPFNKPNAYFSF